MIIVGIFLVIVGFFVYRMGDIIETYTNTGQFIWCYIMSALLFAIGLMCCLGG